MLKYRIILFLLLSSFFSSVLFAQPYANNMLNEKEQALNYIKQTHFERSSFWPEVSPELFEENLRRNIEEPVFLYAGRNTNFCGFAALGYVLLQEDPFGYAKFMIDLYREGKAAYGNANFTPSKAVTEMAGQIMYEGELDKNDADQVLFFTLADHFKGYLNLFNLRYNAGDEQRLWAATNLRKFNRMLRVLFKAEIGSIGSDLFRPSVDNLATFLNEKLAGGDVFLYLNNTILRKKDHNKLRKKVPTHYVVLLSISEEKGVATLTYWDTGLKTRRLITMKTLDKILYGISWSKRKG
jgi:hypothetical protein